MSEYIDEKEALARIRGNVKLYKRMLSLFLEGKENDDFEQAVAEGDLQKAGDLAHTIKGVAGNLSLKPLFELSAELMGQFRSSALDQGTLEAYRDAWVKTREAVEQLVARYQQEGY